MLSFKRIMIHETNAQASSQARQGLRRSVSIAGITAFSRQQSTPVPAVAPVGRRLLQNHPYSRHHPYSQRPRNMARGRNVSRRNSEEGGQKCWSLHKTRRTQSKPKLNKMKGSTNRALDNEHSTCVRSWHVSQVASMLECNLTLNIDLSAAAASVSSASRDKNSIHGSDPRTGTKDVSELRNQVQSVNDSQRAPAIQNKDNTQKSSGEGAFNNASDTVKSETFDIEKDSRKHKDQLTFGKLPFSLMVPNQCSTIQMPTPPIISNISLGGLFTTQAHPRALAAAEVDTHNAVHFLPQPEVDYNNNQLQLLSDGSDNDGDEEEDMDEGFVADDETDDAQIWAPGFDDVSLWTCLYQSNVDTEKMKKEWNDKASKDAANKAIADEGVPASLRKQETVILVLDDAGEAPTNQETEVTDSLVCDPRDIEKEEEDVLNTSFSEFRRLVPVYKDFCCWVCGSLMETMNLFDMLNHDDGEMPPSFSSSMSEGLDLYCPQCDCTRCFFNSTSLLSRCFSFENKD